MKKIIIGCILTIVCFSGCSKNDGVANVVGPVNEYNPDVKSKTAIKAYGEVRKEVRDKQGTDK